MRKVPGGTEGVSILIGQIPFLELPIMAFFRFETASVLEDVMEIPVPTRFVVLILCSKNSRSLSECIEMGRSIAVLFTDKVTNAAFDYSEVGK